MEGASRYPVDASNAILDSPDAATSGLCIVARM